MKAYETNVSVVIQFTMVSFHKFILIEGFIWNAYMSREYVFKIFVISVWDAGNAELCYFWPSIFMAADLRNIFILGLTKMCFCLLSSLYLHEVCVVFHDYTAKLRTLITDVRNRYIYDIFTVANDQNLGKHYVLFFNGATWHINEYIYRNKI